MQWVALSLIILCGAAVAARTVRLLRPHSRWLGAGVVSLTTISFCLVQTDTAPVWLWPVLFGLLLTLSLLASPRIAPAVMAALSFIQVVVATQVTLPTVAVACAAGATVAGFGYLWSEVGVSNPAEMTRLAMIDELTGLGNRRVIDSALAGAIAQASAGEDSRDCALLMIDVDSFKDINDTFGHLVGDEVLRQVGPRLAGQIRATDTLARIGGDEFAVLLIGGTDEAGARLVAQRIAREFQTPMEVGDICLQVAVSIGIALAPHHALTEDGLTHAADSAMYFAKRTRCGHAVYDLGVAY